MPGRVKLSRRSNRLGIRSRFDFSPESIPVLVIAIAAELCVDRTLLSSRSFEVVSQRH